jgi:lysozyme
VRRTAIVLAALITLLALAACGGTGAPKDGVPASTTPATTTPPTPPATSATAAPTTTPSTPATGPTAMSPASPKPAEKPARLLGIDASHHKGPIDWAQVAGHGVTFAYLKASEGTGFIDPRFATNRAGARKHGIKVGGYHYFQLCSDGAAQARHFIGVLGDNGGPAGLPPAIDLELAGSCATPPPRADLLAEVQAFLDALDQRYDARPVVYLYPEFEERFGFATELASYPQWVRRLGKQPPERPWHIWQYDDRGSVPGITGGVDLNWMATE